MRPFPVYIGFNSKFPEVAWVLAHSIRKRSSVPLEIHFINRAYLETYHGFKLKDDPRATTEHTYARFAIPYLMGYNKKQVAWFVDDDGVCFGDVAELARTPMDGLAIRCVHHDHKVAEGATKFGDSGKPQESYPRKNYSSSMLLNCGELKAWTKEVVEESNGKRLHRFEDVPDAKLGELEPKWNVLDGPVESAAFLHLTSGGPWYRGCENVPGAVAWHQARVEWLVETDRDPNTPFVPVKV